MTIFKGWHTTFSWNSRKSKITWNSGKSEKILESGKTKTVVRVQIIINIQFITKETNSLKQLYLLRVKSMLHRNVKIWEINFPPIYGVQDRCIFRPLLHSFSPIFHNFSSPTQYNFFPKQQSQQVCTVHCCTAYKL